MNEVEYQALTKKISILSQEIQSLKEDIAKLKGEAPPKKYTKEEVENFRKSREELIQSYRRFLQEMRKGMDADLIIQYKKTYLDEIGKRFTGEYIARTKSRFLAEFEFAYNSSPKIIIVDNYTIPIDGNTMGARDLMATLKAQKPDITDNDIRTVANHYYARIHTDNIPAMMAMLEKALSGTPDTPQDGKMPWEDDTWMEVR